MHKSNYIYTLWWSSRVSKSACPSALFIVSHYWLCASLLWESYFCRGRRQTCENWLCGGWTLVSVLCAYNCTQPPWSMPLKCATLFTTGSKDLKPVGDVHICVQVCVDTRGHPGCCSSWHGPPRLFDIESHIDLEFTKSSTRLLIQ